MAHDNPSRPRPVAPREAALAAELIAMCDADQRAWYAMVGPDGAYAPDDDPGWQRQDQRRRAHTERLQQIMHTLGWPTISLVGAEAATAAWLLAQHSDHDVDVQRQALAAMTAAGDDVDPADRAYLVDRVARAEGREQEYGTQLESGPEGTVTVQPLRDPGQVDQRRAAAGLGPLVDYLAGSHRPLARAQPAGASSPPVPVIDRRLLRTALHQALQEGVGTFADRAAALTDWAQDLRSDDAILDSVDHDLLAQTLADLTTPDVRQPLTIEDCRSLLRRLAQP